MSWWPAGERRARGPEWARGGVLLNCGQSASFTGHRQPSTLLRYAYDQGAAEAAAASVGWSPKPLRLIVLDGFSGTQIEGVEQAARPPAAGAMKAPQGAHQGVPVEAL